MGLRAPAVWQTCGVFHIIIFYRKFCTSVLNIHSFRLGGLVNRKKESQWYVDTLEQALKPMAVQNAGDNIDVVKKILIERNSTEAVKVINDVVTLKGANYFDNSIQAIIDYYKTFYIYPEADFLEAKIYRLEGEFELAKQFYIEAWKNSDKLDIPMEKYDILYELASLYKIQNNLADYEKTLLFFHFIVFSTVNEDVLALVH